MAERSLVSPEGQTVTFVELFFDLVFVFAITQVVGILHDGITWVSVGQSALVFWIIWWGWTQFTWALNAANTDHANVQLGTLLATAVAFFMAVAVPESFGGAALWFAAPYVAVRVIGLAIYMAVASDDDQKNVVGQFAYSSLGGFAAVLIGAWMGGETQYALWGLAILLDVIAAGAARGSGWNLHAEHFVERHGLIVIIALGESLIVAASGLVGAERTWPLLATGGLAVAITCALWWSYFPYVRPNLERALEEAPVEKTAPMARDAFSLGHYPMLLGVIFAAVAVEEAILHVSDPLPFEGRLALASGLVLFVGGTAFATWRAVCYVPVLRIVTVLLTGAAIVLSGELMPWMTLAVALGGLAVVVVAEHQTVRRLDGEAARQGAPTP